MKLSKKLSARKLAILYLLDAPDEEGKTPSSLSGTTKLQKLLFLLQRGSTGLLDENFWEMDFEYVAEKYGPADLNLYRDLDFLAATGHINMAGSLTRSDEPSLEVLFDDQPGDPALPEELEEEELSFQYLMAPSADEIIQQESGVEKVYEITRKGLHLLEELEKGSEEEQKVELEKLREACRGIKAKFGAWPLKRLLEHVYRGYPDMITESTIKDRVLGT